MTFEVEMPNQEEMQQPESNFARLPGTYHVVIVQMYEGAIPKKDGSTKVIDGFCASLQILDGTARSGNKCAEEGKTLNLIIFNPKLTSKDEGKFARRKQAAFCIAANLVDLSKTGQKVQVDLKQAINQQIVLKLEESKGDDGKTYLDLAFSDIWHVDDPRVAPIPKNQDALKLIPSQFRHPAEWFAPLLSASQQASSQQQQQSNGNGSKQTAGAQAAAASFNPDDL